MYEHEADERLALIQAILTARSLAACLADPSAPDVEARDDTWRLLNLVLAAAKKITPRQCKM